jgi:curli biogenesis system outer membrane secretion channel CsgG
MFVIWSIGANWGGVYLTRSSCGQQSTAPLPLNITESMQTMLSKPDLYSSSRAVCDSKCRQSEIMIGFDCDATASSCLDWEGEILLNGFWTPLAGLMMIGP